ncbi:MAG: hypothetical protein WKG01_04170 [Kofleriaceae bacterium]
MAFGLVLFAACGSSDDDIDSDEEAQRAYLGLDLSVEKSLALGFAGFNAASSANIAPQATTGGAAGDLTITGQVDQGSSDNKGMRLRVGMVDYTDGVILVETEDDTELEINLTYDTSTDVATQPFLNLSLRGIPETTATTGTLTGTLLGDYTMSGDIEGTATLNLSFTGEIEDDGAGNTIRSAGTTHVTGTASSGDGVFDVDLML